VTTQTAHAMSELNWLESGEFYRDPIGGAVVLVLRAPAEPGVLRCNGVEMIRSRPLPCGYRSARVNATYLRPGLRYRDGASGLEVRCLRGGYGYLSFRRRPLVVS
jgi:hypothetical protein